MVQVVVVTNFITASEASSQAFKTATLLKTLTVNALIMGEVGVGKSTLALEYGVSSIKEGIYDYVIWLDVENGINKEVKKFTLKYLTSDTDDGREDDIYYKNKFNNFLERFLDKNEYGIADINKWLPYRPMLIVMLAIENFNNKNYDKINQWYWSSVFSERFNLPFLKNFVVSFEIPSL